MVDMEDNELFWKIIFRNQGKTILMDLSEKWVRLTVDSSGSIKSEVGYTLQDVNIDQDQFEEFKDSQNLKLVLSDAFDSNSFSKAFVVENTEIRREKDEVSKRR